MGITLNSTQRGPSDAWRLANPLLHLCPGIVALLALCVPVNVLENTPWLASWCAAVIALFPFLGKHAAVSAFPQVTTLVMCVSWVLILPSICLVWIVLWPYRKRALERVRLGLSKQPDTKLALYAAIGFPLVIYGCWFLAGDPSFCKDCATGSRTIFAVLIYGALITLGFLPWFIATIFYINYFLKSPSGYRLSMVTDVEEFLKLKSSCGRSHKRRCIHD